MSPAAPTGNYSRFHFTFHQREREREREKERKEERERRKKGNNNKNVYWKAKEQVYGGVERFNVHTNSHTPQPFVSISLHPSGELWNTFTRPHASWALKCLRADQTLNQTPPPPAHSLIGDTALWHQSPGLRHIAVNRTWCERSAHQVVVGLDPEELPEVPERQRSIGFEAEVREVVSRGQVTPLTELWGKKVYTKCTQMRTTENRGGAFIS